MTGALFAIDRRPGWLIARLPGPQRVLSWSLNRPGLVEADTVAWLQVANADLPVQVDPLQFLERRLAEQELARAVGLMTARELGHYQIASSGDGDVRVETLATVGLGNGVAFDATGQTTDVRFRESVGTINMLVAVSCPLGEAAMLEAISIAATARTAALLADGGRIVGTGTDCTVIACPNGAAAHRYAGLHTAIGRHIAASVYRAIRLGRNEWRPPPT